VVSASGTFLQQTAIGWLVLQLTGSATSLGLVLAAGGLPSLVLGPWGGAIADRVDLRKLLILTQTIFGLLAALLWILAVEGNASVPVIVTISVLSGFVQIVDSPARQAFISRLVSPEDLTSAVSLNGVVVNTARVVGRRWGLDRDGRDDSVLRRECCLVRSSRGRSAVGSPPRDKRAIGARSRSSMPPRSLSSIRWASANGWRPVTTSTEQGTRATTSMSCSQGAWRSCSIPTVRIALSQRMVRGGSSVS